ncbi:MAG: ImcF-related family protein [Gammaproteobacteria bacterium]
MLSNLQSFSWQRAWSFLPKWSFNFNKNKKEEDLFVEGFKKKISQMEAYNLPLVVYTGLDAESSVDLGPTSHRFSDIAATGIDCLVTQEAVYFVLDSSSKNAIAFKILSKILKKVKTYLSSSKILFMYSFTQNYTILNKDYLTNIFKNNAVINNLVDEYLFCLKGMEINIQNICYLNDLKKSMEEWINLNAVQKMELLDFDYELNKKELVLKTVKQTFQDAMGGSFKIRGEILNFENNRNRIFQQERGKSNFQKLKDLFQSSQVEAYKTLKISALVLSLIYILGAFCAVPVHYKIQNHIHKTNLEILNLDLAHEGLNRFDKFWFKIYGLGKIQSYKSYLSQKIVKIAEEEKLPVLKLALEQDLETKLTQGSHAELYQALKQYLAFPKLDIEPWNKIYLKHQKNQMMPPMALKQNLIHNARLKLQHWMASEDEIYSKLEDEAANHFKTLDTFSLFPKTRAEGLELNSELPGFYTASAFKNYIKPQIQKIVDQCSKPDPVLGLNTENKGSVYIKSLEKRLTQRYLYAYKTAWFNWLDNIQVKSLHSLEEASGILDLMSHPEGILQELKLVLKDNLGLLELQGLMTDAEKNILRNILEKEPPLKVFEKLKKEVDLLYMQEERGLASLKFVKAALEGSKKAGSIQKLVKLEREWMNGGLGNLYLSLVQNTWRVLLQEASLGLEQKWQQEVLPTYEKLKFYYPFSPSDSEAKWSEVMQFFDLNQGVLRNFTEEYLKPFTQIKSGYLEPKRYFGQGLSLSPIYLRQVSEALELGKLLSQQEGIKLWVYPKPNEAWSEVSLNINGSLYRYRNEPEEYRELLWNPNKGEGNSWVRARLAKTERSLEQTGLGTWGFWRILKQASLEYSADGLIWATWDLKPKHTDSEYSEALKLGLKFTRDTQPMINLIRNGLDLPVKIVASVELED